MTQDPKPAISARLVLVPIQPRPVASLSLSAAMQQELYRLAFERAQAEADEREWFDLLEDYSI